MQRIRGMVEVGGMTFRIEWVEESVYEVIRIQDDVNVGAFRTAPILCVVRTQLEPALMQAIARAAVRGGKVSWVRGRPPS
jgi:hypothetical protein